MVKGLAAGATNTVLALLLGASFPPPSIAGAAAVLGFLGYGISLALFVLVLPLFAAVIWLGDRGPVPPGTVLLLQRHQLAAGEATLAAGVGEEQQREQAGGLGLVRHQLRQGAGQADGGGFVGFQDRGAEVHLVTAGIAQAIAPIAETLNTDDFDCQGSGRTELLEGIFGVTPFTRGELLVDGTTVTVRTPRQSVRS